MVISINSPYSFVKKSSGLLSIKNGFLIQLCRWINYSKSLLSGKFRFVHVDSILTSWSPGFENRRYINIVTYGDSNIIINDYIIYYRVPRVNLIKNLFLNQSGIGPLFCKNRAKSCILCPQDKGCLSEAS